MKPFQIFIVVVLIAGVILGIYLVGNPTRFLPKAASEPIQPSPSSISGPINASPSPAVTSSPSMQADDDQDGFSNSVELLMGTNPNKSCADSSTDNAWPVDTNNNQVINGGDVSKIVPYVSGLLGYNKRYDLNLDGINNRADVDIIAKYFLQECGQIDPQATPNPSVVAMYDIANVADLIINRKVDIFDFNQLVGEFGARGQNILSDINKDEIVNIFDFNILVQNFGRTY
jgi:hypothetical protein